MKLRIDSASGATEKHIRQLLSYTDANVTSDIQEVRVQVDGRTDALGNPLVSCRVQLNLTDGGLVRVDELQSTLDLALTRALERGVRTVKRRRIRPNQAA